MPTLLPMFCGPLLRNILKVNLIIKEQNTENLIRNLQDGHIDAAIAATAFGNPIYKITPRLYYEPFVGYGSAKPIDWDSVSELNTEDFGKIRCFAFRGRTLF